MTTTSERGVHNLSAMQFSLSFQRLFGSRSGNIPLSRAFPNCGFRSGDSLRDMEPRSTPPEDESLGIPNTETVLISSNSETVTKLCGVCSSIPAWFWTQELEEDEEISVELQPFKGMRAEARNGCGLCMILCSEDYTVLEEEWRHVKVSMDTLLELGTGQLVKYRVGEYKIRGRFKEARTWLGAVYPFSSSWRPRSLAAADENSDLMLIQDWINNCQLNHISCNNVTKDFLPTRLLDVEAFNNGRSPGLKDDVKLVRSASYQIQKGGSAPQYITLSHCWGPPEKRPITTTQANLSVRMERISFAELPRTFQDAVVLTRKLGHRYLWIDSLCIIQDDESDWAREASTMAEVYAQSYCTLAALSSADSTGGLRMSKKTQTDKDILINISANDGHHGPFDVRLVFRPNDWEGEYDGLFSGPEIADRGEKVSPLRYRAWALQEKELSTRIVHFGFRQLLWECCELKGTTQLPWYHIMGPMEINELEREREWAKGHPEGSILFYRMSASWLNLCRDYSARSLTKETDKLIALSGIARSFQKYFPNDKYIAGIWSSNLPLALLWYPSRDGKEWYTTVYIAPSWSWASQPTWIRYDHLEFPDLFRMMASKTSGPVDKWLDELKVVKITGQPKHSDDYGALKEGAALELRGALLFELDSGLKSSAGAPPLFFFRDGVSAGSFYPDAPGMPQGRFVCLGIFYSQLREGVTGLILTEHIRDGSPVYSRVGYVDGVDPALWDDSERRHITLI